MKKVLLASTALLAFGAVSAQAADPIKLSIGGNITETVGYADNAVLNKDNDVSTATSGKRVQFGNAADATISIKGQTKLDNGISVAVNFDLYGTQAPQSRSINGACGTSTGLVGTTQTAAACKGNSFLKRSYVTVSSKAGSFIVGEREDATYIVHNSAPDVSPISPVGDGQWYYWVASPSQHRGLSLDNDSRYDDRGLKTTYISPSFHGLAAAFSYIPNISSSQGSNGTMADTYSSDNANYAGKGYINGNDFGGDAFGGGFAYSNTLGGVGVKADATVVQANITNLRIYQQGAQITYAGFTVGGSSLIRSVPSDATVNGVYTNALAASYGGARVTPAALAQAAAYAGNNYTLGISYATGPYAVSVAYFHDNSKSVIGLNGTGKADTTNVYDFGTAYTAGPGVVFRAGVGYVEYKGTNLSSATPWNNNNFGVVGTTGVKLDF